MNIYTVFSDDQKLNRAALLLCIAILLFSESLFAASLKTSNQELLLWNVDPTQYQSINIVFSEKACSAIPTLTAGQMYHLKLINNTGKELTNPLPKSFLSSVSIQSLSVTGMRMHVSSLQGISINNGGAMTLELIPVSTGSWNINCSKQPIETIASPHPFPPAQPKLALHNDLLKVPKPLSDFSLKYQDTQAFDQSTVRGRWSVLFFGYTYCPDVCPTNLYHLSQAYNNLPTTLKDKLDIIFISVDPERDNPKVLDQYVQHFSSDFFGVTGTSHQIANLADQLSVSFRIPNKRSGNNYDVSHTADYFLLSPDVRLVARINHERQPDEIATTITTAWEYFKLVSKTD